MSTRSQLTKDLNGELHFYLTIFWNSIGHLEIREGSVRMTNNSKNTILFLFTSVSVYYKLFVFIK